MARTPRSEAVRQASELAKLEVPSSTSSAPTSRSRSRSCEDERRGHPRRRRPRGQPARGRQVRPSTRRRRQAKKAKVDVEVTHPREGDPADAILDVAEENKADLIIVGNKGMTGAKRFLLGSVPEQGLPSLALRVIIVHTT